jgi:ubiquinone/menaquinone biosynthesis C-methylase UbiE
MRVKKFIRPHGNYFLDAGSGAISHPEYIEYSSGYKRRVCVDFSAKALAEARSKLKDHGLYVLADLTRLPFKEQTFDSTVCAHVLYHIPQDEQKAAIFELYRTQKQGGNCVIVYTWPTSAFTKFALNFNTKWITKKIGRLPSMIPGVRSVWTRLAKPAGQKANDEKPKQPTRPPLYFHPHDYQWFQETLPDNWETDIRCWRSVGRVFTTRFVGNNFAGRLFVELLFKLETIFPHTLARLGQYPMILIRK